MRIAGFQKTSFIDYPNKISAIIFTQGCNFKCGYCHNPELNDCSLDTEFDEKEIIDFLKTRKNKLDAIVITGGEPTLQKDLKIFIQKIKDIGFLVKLDTNGTNPKLLKELVNEGLVDYVAMDIKQSLEKYSEITNTTVKLENISESIDFIKNSGVDYEFRTTVLKKQISYDDFEKIAELLKGSKEYYLQKFVISKMIDENLITAQTYTDKEFEEIKKIMLKNILKVEVR